MKKLAPVAVAIVSMAVTGLASAEELARVDDPTPTGQFTGTYDCSYYTYDADGNATKTTRTCDQAGYVALYDDGVVACNGNEGITRPDNGEPLQGYVWLGPAHASSGDKPATFAAPMNAFGAGNNNATDKEGTAGTDEAHGPCEDATPPKS